MTEPRATTGTTTQSARRSGPVSAKAGAFTESVIREMTRLCIEHGGVNLAQGFPDFPCPPSSRTRRRRPSTPT